jgi:hypothetical protein
MRQIEIDFSATTSTMMTVIYKKLDNDGTITYGQQSATSGASSAYPSRSIGRRCAKAHSSSRESASP